MPLPESPPLSTALLLTLMWGLVLYSSLLPEHRQLWERIPAEQRFTNLLAVIIERKMIHRCCLRYSYDISCIDLHSVLQLCPVGMNDTSSVFSCLAFSNTSIDQVRSLSRSILPREFNRDLLNSDEMNFNLFTKSLRRLKDVRSPSVCLSMSSYSLLFLFNVIHVGGGLGRQAACGRNLLVVWTNMPIFVNFHRAFLHSLIDRTHRIWGRKVDLCLSLFHYLEQETKGVR